MPAEDGPSPAWCAVEVRVARDDVDLLSGQLWDAGVAGIEELDVDADGDGDVIVRAMVDGVTPGPDGDDTASLERVRAACRLHGEPTVHHIDPDEGLDAWRPWAAPVRVGDVLVTPTWWDGQLDDAPIVVRLDAGRTFGSGSHASTRLTLALMHELVRPGATVLDVGCGSGILTIAAVRLGAGRVVAVDVDPDATQVTRGNAEHNGVADRVTTSTESLDTLERDFDVIVANISATVLSRLAPSIAARRRDDNAVVIVSGFLDEQGSQVAEAFAPRQVIDRRHEGEWSAFVIA